MSEINIVFIPVINYLKNVREPIAEVLGAYMDEIEALHAIIRRLVELEFILDFVCFDPVTTGCDQIEFEREILCNGDNEGNILKLCKYVKTMADIEYICTQFDNTYYKDTWFIQMNCHKVK